MKHVFTNDTHDIAQEVVRSGAAPLAGVGWYARSKDALRGDRAGALVTGGADTRLFDLASLTKPMAAVAFARSGLDRRAPLAEYLPELAATVSGPLPIELFFAHRAGLEAHLPLYAPLATRWGAREPGTFDPREAMWAAASARRSDAGGAPPEDGFPPVYSDLGYILAGAAMARALGLEDAGAAIDAWGVRPLGLEAELGTARDLTARGVDLVARAAPTEDIAWRGGVVRGAVHDENAWALTGHGGSGHAGMFGTVRAVLAFAKDVLDHAGDDDVAWLVRERPGGTLRAGFDGKSKAESSAGARMGSGAIGHLGFTGTSFWIDPDEGVVVSLLTNRVHPTRENVRIRAIRPRTHDALFALATAQPRVA